MSAVRFLFDVPIYLFPTVAPPMSNSRIVAAPRMVRLVALLMATSTMLSGCHRHYYRKQADGEAYLLIDEKASHIARPPNNVIRIEVDQRSRMFNPFDVDFQPMPLDDPASYRYMQCVDGRRGYPMWEAAGVTNTAENPDWWQFLPLDDDGVLVLNTENAVRIALLHSPEYQRELEELYLAALDVSTQRFVFDTQFFGGLGTSLSLGRSDGPGSPATSILGFPSTAGGGNRTLIALERTFATGGELVVGLANRLVWDLGANDQNATTILDFSFLQPLLRTAGRDVVLESLTQSERRLLARVRSFERFRRSFYLNIAVGSRLEVQANTAVGLVSINPVAGGGAGGFLSLLQNQLQIRNSEENIARLQEQTLLYEDSLIELLTTIPEDAGQVLSQRLQVAQSRQSLVSSQQSLINQQAGFQRDVDAFLRNLGLPPYICVRLDDPFLDQFQLIDRDLLDRRKELSVLRSNVGAINVSILERGEFVLDPDTGLPVSQIQWTPELATSLEELETELKPLAEFIDVLLEQDLPAVRADIENLSQAIPERQAQNESLQQLYETNRDSICSLLEITEIDDAVFDLDDLATLSDDLVNQFAQLRGRLETYKADIESLVKTFDDLKSGEAAAADPRDLALRLRDDIILASQDLAAALGDDVLTLQLIQARARTESVTLQQVDIAPEVALEIARKNRRDWANARAAIVDSWRNIEVVADDLESDLDFVFNGSVENLGNNPLKLNTRTGNLRVGLEWDAPITRINERNDYRTALIQYERDKRTFYQYEDGVWQLLRSELRQLQANRFTFELGRELIRNSAAQIELTTDSRALQEARGQPIRPTDARDQIQALNALLNAQNNLLNIFVGYEVLRRSLDLDLGTMELTPEGLWIDPGQISPETLLSLPGTTNEGMIECNCNECGLPYHPLPPEPYYSSEMLQEGQVEQAVDFSQAIDIAAPMGEIEEIVEEVPQDLPPPIVDPQADLPLEVTPQLP